RSSSEEYKVHWHRSRALFLPSNRGRGGLQRMCNARTLAGILGGSTVLAEKEASKYSAPLAGTSDTTDVYG
ncbi:Hypothetical predicted protein, partial [Pelobates cultripes]